MTGPHEISSLILRHTLVGGGGGRCYVLLLAVYVFGGLSIRAPLFETNDVVN